MKLVFVYGTLRPGQKYHHLIRKYVVSASPAFVAGRLYHLPEGYPALLLAEDRQLEQLEQLEQLDKAGQTAKVRGDLLGFASLEPVFPILDELEDYYGPHDPRNLYERVTLSAVLKNGAAVPSISYVFPREKADWLQRDAIFIPEGDWVKWKKRRSPLS